MDLNELQNTIDALAQPGRGILAADESSPTVKKRFDSINLESTEDNRRAYRQMLFTAPDLGKYVAGVILFEETLKQSGSCGTAFPEVLRKNNMVPGIKVDKGITGLSNSEGDNITRGLDGLGERLDEYKEFGAKFTKWRAVLPITNVNPRRLAIRTNAEVLARYAAIAQNHGYVPIVEPEILIDGDHTIERCAEVSEEVLRTTFTQLNMHKVKLEYMILKPSMVISGKGCATQASVEQVASETVKILRRTVPAAVPTINFLSGGQTELQATQHLQLMNEMLNANYKPWNVSFSYARALQAPALQAWQGQEANVAVAQQILVKRARLNSAASCGEYQASMEQE